MIEIKFDIGHIVFLKTDIDQLERIVTGISIRPDGVSYILVNGTTESYHYDFEINEKRDIVKATSS